MPTTDWVIDDATSDPGYVKTVSPLTTTSNINEAAGYASTFLAQADINNILVPIYGTGRFAPGKRPRP